MTNEEINNVGDGELVQRTLASANEFKEIVLRYESAMRRYIIRLGCRNGDDVEDVLQEIFLKVYINLKDYDTDLKFSSWLYRIAHNETISFFRKKNIRPTTVATEEALALFENLADEDDFIQSIDKRMDAEILRSALFELSDEYRDVIVLKFLEEKSYDEISDILKIPIGTVGTLIHRGKKRLRDILILKNIHL